MTWAPSAGPPADPDGRTLLDAFEGQFASAAGAKGYVLESDLYGGNVVQLQLLRILFDPADRDGDGKLTRAEFDAYFGTLQRVADFGLVVVPAVRTPTLFALLDADRDGRLSRRELRTAWDRLRPLEPLPGVGVTRAAIRPNVTLRLARRFDQPAVVVPPAAVPSAVPVVPTSGPLWFRKLDRNGDGDVSWAEFVGPRAVFDRLDADGDGLISRQEAEAFDRRGAGKK